MNRCGVGGRIPIDGGAKRFGIANPNELSPVDQMLRRVDLSRSDGYTCRIRVEVDLLTHRAGEVANWDVEGARFVCK